MAYVPALFMAPANNPHLGVALSNVAVPVGLRFGPGRAKPRPVKRMLMRVAMPLLGLSNIIVPRGVMVMRRIFRMGRRR